MKAHQVLAVLLVAVSAVCAQEAPPANGRLLFFIRGSRAAAAQTPEALDRWLKANDAALMRFLPNASSAGMTVDPAPAFSGPANETYTYKGANSMVQSSAGT
jgi:hypothetical protein